MPRIKLKHKSPEYDNDALPREAARDCDMPGCAHHGMHKAPKHRGLNEYYFFCQDHAREYNMAWDYFSGMSSREVETHIYNSYYGDRPTWKYAEHDLFEAARKMYDYDDEKISAGQEKTARQGIEQNSPEFEALAIIGLTPPVTLDTIKARYKALVKKHHPDINRDDPEAEELLKRINMAYTILKLAFEEYRRLPDHKF